MSSFDATLHQAWRGDATAFERVYLRFQPVVASTVSQILRYDVQDTTQEVWQAVFQYFRKKGRLPEQTEHFERFLRQVAHWCAYAEYRQRVRRSTHMEAITTSTTREDLLAPDENAQPIERREAWRRLLDAYRKLGARERECMRLTRRLGRADAAQQMGITPKTLRNHLSNAYAKLLRPLLGN